jgi:hypothetical protein
VLQAPGSAFLEQVVCLLESLEQLVQCLLWYLEQDVCLLGSHVSGNTFDMGVTLHMRFGPTAHWGKAA